MASTNRRTSNLIDHITSDVHKGAMAKLKVELSRARGKSAAMSTTIGHFFLSLMDDEMRERIQRRSSMRFMMGNCESRCHENMHTP